MLSGKDRSVASTEVADSLVIVLKATLVATKNIIGELIDFIRGSLLYYAAFTSRLIFSFAFVRFPPCLWILGFLA